MTATRTRSAGLAARPRECAKNAAAVTPIAVSFMNRRRESESMTSSYDKVEHLPVTYPTANRPKVDAFGFIRR
jgi:hypothetical protein